MKSIFKHVSLFLVTLFIILVPLAISTQFSNFFDFPKLILASLFTVLLLLVFYFEILTTRKLFFSSHQMNLAVLSLMIAYILSPIFSAPNKMESFLLPGTTTLVLVMGVYYFLANYYLKNLKHWLLHAVFYSLVIASILSIFGFLNVFSDMTILPQIFKNPSFSFMGGRIYELVFQISVIPLGINLIFKDKDVVKITLNSIALLIIAISVVLNINSVMPGHDSAPILVPLKESWAITVDTVKNQPIFGVGSGNYLSAFSKYLPITYNQFDYWAIRFSTSRSYLLTIVSELGLVGLAAFVVLTVSVIGILRDTKIKFSDHNFIVAISFSILLLSLVIFPANNFIIIFIFILASIFEAKSEKSFNLNVISSILLSTVVIIPVLIFIIYAKSALVAEYLYQRSLVNLSQENIAEAYSDIRDAVKTNTYVDRYHTSFSQISLGNAKSVASQEGELSADDRQIITTLVQQSINEAKAAVALNPQRAETWANLAFVYQSIIPLAQEADKFAVKSYLQATVFDPLNPNIRISLGQLYLAMQQTENAIKTFELATLAKPDLANAHYNLAIAYKTSGDIQKATDEMNKTLSLLGKETLGYDQALKELKDIKELSTPTESNQ